MTRHGSAGQGAARTNPWRPLEVFALGLAFDLRSAQSPQNEQILAGQRQTAQLPLPDADELSGADSRHSSRMTV